MNANKLKGVIGRLAMRVCATDKPKDTCVTCHLCHCCRCAREDWNAVTVMEQKFWVIMAICAAALVLGYFL